MHKLLAALLITSSLLTACGEKVYSADDVYKDYQVNGESSKPYQELKTACMQDRDEGDPFSKACKVFGVVSVKIRDAEDRAFMQKNNK